MSLQEVDPFCQTTFFFFNFYQTRLFISLTLCGYYTQLFPFFNPL